MVRYNGADEHEGPPEDLPESSNVTPFWPTIIWFLIAMAAVTVLGLVVKTQGVGP